MKTSRPCTYPLNPKPQRRKAEVDVQPMILDDPNTKEPEDFWMHPCDAWQWRRGLLSLQQDFGESFWGVEGFTGFYAGFPRIYRVLQGS